MKKKIKRIAAVLLMALFVLAMLGECGASDSEQTEKKQEEKTQEESKQEEKEVVTEKVTPSLTPSPTPLQSEMKVHFLDVAQGLSVLVQSGGENLLYDGGDTKTSSFVVAYLKEQGVTSIDYLISSHYDSDHLAGLIGCLKAFEVKNIIGSDYVHDSKLYTSFTNAVTEKKLEVEHPEVGTKISFGTGSFMLLAPEQVEGSNKNNNSVVIKLTNGEHNFILTGDAEHDSEAAMCASGNDLECDVLLLGHHGSATATSWGFLEKTVPQYAVISCGADNQYGHPDKDTLDKLQAMDIQLYRTDLQGTITVQSDGKVLIWNQKPCEDYSAGAGTDEGTKPVTEEPEPTNEPTQIPTKEPTQKPTVKPTVSPTKEATQKPTAKPTKAPTKEPQDSQSQSENVWISATGKKYHNKPDCGRMNPNKARKITRSEAEAKGYGACSKCY